MHHMRRHKICKKRGDREQQDTHSEISTGDTYWSNQPDKETVLKCKTRKH